MGHDLYIWNMVGAHRVPGARSGDERQLPTRPAQRSRLPVR
jgi:hypothetical protein